MGEADVRYISNKRDGGARARGHGMRELQPNMSAVKTERGIGRFGGVVIFYECCC